MFSATQLRKSLIFIHRWMGVCLCLLFFSWFVSGIVLMYCDYPMVSPADRLAHAPPLDPAAIVLSPQQAYARLKEHQQIHLPPDDLKLATYDARPVYKFTFGDSQALVYADTGQLQLDFPPALTLRVASAWAHQPPSAPAVAEVTQPDQWTVSGEFAALRPLRKYSWPDGQQIYVSTVTGEVVQYTTRARRLGAYFGAIPHWLYFTPLRRRPHSWTRAVVWSSGLAILAALLGIAIGIWMYSSSKRYRPAYKPSSIPYVGQKRWHMALRLLFGPLVCTWAFSGMLSMDPFPQLQGESPDEPGFRIQQALRGPLPPLSDFAAQPPQQAINQANALANADANDQVKAHANSQAYAHASAASRLQIRELQFAAFNGQPVYLAASSATHSLIVPVTGEPAPQFDHQSILRLVRQAAQPFALARARLVTQYESYYLDRLNRLPLPVIFVQLNDQAASMYYIDPKTAQIVESYNARGRWNRWLYHGLHSMDLPWLYRHRPLWDVLVLALLTGGAGLCFTSLLLAWRVLWRIF